MNDSERKETITARLSSSPRRLNVWIQAWRFGTYGVSLRSEDGAVTAARSTNRRKRAAFVRLQLHFGRIRFGPEGWECEEAGGAESGRARREEKRASPSRSLFLPAEDVLVLVQYELHDLVLVDHVDRHVEGLGLGPQQRGAEHDGHALGGHAVLLPVVDHPGGGTLKHVVCEEEERGIVGVVVLQLLS